MCIVNVLLHYDRTGGFRLRIGDYRVLLMLEQHTIQVTAVRYRREVYR